MSDPYIEEDDYIISDVPGGYRVNVLGEVFDDFDIALEAIRDDMNWKQWWPNVWFINDHGNVDLIGLSDCGYKIIESWV